MLLALCGLQGAGKDTVGRLLVDGYGFRRVSFGGALKDVVSRVFGWDRELLEGATDRSRRFRETVDPWWATRLAIPDFTPRKALQLVGTEALRDGFHRDIWCAAVERTLDAGGGGPVVITDCRFPGEVDMVRRRGGKVACVLRDVPPWLVRYKNGETDALPAGLHASEHAWVRCDFDYVISNAGSLDQLRERVEALAPGRRRGDDTRRRIDRLFP